MVEGEGNGKREDRVERERKGGMEGVDEKGTE